MNMEHDGEVQYADIERFGAQVSLVYGTDGYELRIREGYDNVSLSLPEEEAESVLDTFNGGDWDYSECSECPCSDE